MLSIPHTPGEGRRHATTSSTLLGSHYYQRSPWQQFTYPSIHSHSSLINVRLFGYEPKNGQTRVNHPSGVFPRLLWGHLRASSWSRSSSFPSFLLTLCRKLVPWKPLPWPSKRMTMVLKLLTKTVAQSTRNCSDTI